MPHLLSLGSTASHTYACDFLRDQGFVIERSPSPFTEAVLLDVPSGEQPDTLLVPMMKEFHSQIHVFGGNLTHPLPRNMKATDLLCDPDYTARNADITARCAIRLACGHLTKTLLGLPVLVVGWGRIGKCLAMHLKNLGAECRVYARKESDRAMLNALGYRAVSEEGLAELLPDTELVLNTVPAPVLDAEATAKCSGVLVELASTPGIIGDNVIWARGLPGKMAPASSGALIAKTVRRLWEEDKQ